MIIEAILNIISSKFDKSGNRNFAFTYTETATGKYIFAKTSGGESNIRGIIFELGGKSWANSKRVYVTTQELGIREFNGLVKDWPYAGSQPEDLAKFVTNGLTNFETETI